MTAFPTHRIPLFELAPRQYAALARLEATIELDHELRELVKIRASQINGCAFCLDMHWKDARASGMPEDRLYSVAVWRESPLYNERERAALALTEAVTLVADGQVPDDVWDVAADVFAPEELAQLVFAIVSINTWNRLAITSRTEPGHYDPVANPIRAVAS